MAPNERTPLIATNRIAPQQYGTRRFSVVTISTIVAAIIWIVVSILPSSPVTDTQTCYSSLGTSRAYASAEALNNNVDDFCRNVANNIFWGTISRTWSRSYYTNTPEGYKMTVTLSNRTFLFDQYHCATSMSSIINDCDAPVGASNPMKWKQGGKLVQRGYTYQIDISRQNRPWPPPAKPMQSCEGWYKFFFQHYDIYGAGWANYDWGQNSLLPAINPCCGLGTLKSGRHTLFLTILGSDHCLTLFLTQEV